MRFKYILAALITIFAIVGTQTFLPFLGEKASATGGGKCPEGVVSSVCDDKRDLEGGAKNAIDVMLIIVGILSVIMIIASGIMFVVAAGNPQTIQRAKTTLIYSVVGLVVSLLAGVIVNYIIKKI